MPEDPLEVDTLPSDPREMALRLLGMTVSELKEIDNKVVSGKQFVGGVKSDLNKIVNDVTVNLKPKQVQPQPPLQPASQPPPQLASAPDITQQVQQPVILQNGDAPQTYIQEPRVDDNQLEFNFYRKIKPEDLEYQIKKMVSSIEDLTVKVDLLYNHLLKKSTRKINGNHSQ